MQFSNTPYNFFYWCLCIVEQTITKEKKMDNSYFIGNNARISPKNIADTNWPNAKKSIGDTRSALLMEAAQKD